MPACAALAALPVKSAAGAACAFLALSETRLSACPKLRGASRPCSLLCCRRCADRRTCGAGFFRFIRFETLRFLGAASLHPQRGRCLIALVPQLIRLQALPASRPARSASVSAWRCTGTASCASLRSSCSSRFPLSLDGIFPLALRLRMV